VALRETGSKQTQVLLKGSGVWCSLRAYHPKLAHHDVLPASDGGAAPLLARAAIRPLLRKVDGSGGGGRARRALGRVKTTGGEGFLETEEQNSAALPTATVPGEAVDTAKVAEEEPKAEATTKRDGTIGASAVTLSPRRPANSSVLSGTSAAGKTTSIAGSPVTCGARNRQAPSRANTTERATVAVLTPSRRPTAEEGPRQKVEAEGHRPLRTDQRGSPQTLGDDL
jgi:hypothetical protein